MATVRELVTKLTYDVDNRGLRKYARGARNAMQDTRQGLSKSKKKAGGLRVMLTSVGAKFAVVAGAATAAAGVVVGVLASWNKEASEFQARLVEIGNTAGFTSKQLKSLQKFVDATTKITGQSGSELLDAMGVLV